MKSDDILDKLLEYLKGEEWKVSVRLFVDANCRRFVGRGRGSYGHDRYMLWKVRTGFSYH
jgi:hypothetical protein